MDKSGSEIIPTTLKGSRTLLELLSSAIRNCLEAYKTMCQVGIPLNMPPMVIARKDIRYYVDLYRGANEVFEVLHGTDCSDPECTPTVFQDRGTEVREAMVDVCSLMEEHDREAADLGDWRDDRMMVVGVDLGTVLDSFGETEDKHAKSRDAARWN